MSHLLHPLMCEAFLRQMNYVDYFPPPPPVKHALPRHLLLIYLFIHIKPNINSSKFEGKDECNLARYKQVLESGTSKN